MWWVLNEATVDSALLDALEQRTKLPIGCYSLRWRDVKTQAQHKDKTPAKMLPSTLRILVLYNYIGKDVQSAFLL